MGRLRGNSIESMHRYLLQNRRGWFTRDDASRVVVWWGLPGTIPTLAEAKDKPHQLETGGPGPDAFTFQQAFDAGSVPTALPKLFRHEGQER
jgi:hypothetical protein